MQCASCGNLLEDNFAWKGARGQFYCGEFCAESEAVEAVKGGPASAPTLLAHHLHRPYERLERLLPYMRQYSAQTASQRRAA
jgi:hypothetical protein